AEEFGGPGSYILDTVREVASSGGKDYVEYLYEITTALGKKLNRKLYVLEAKTVHFSKLCEICKSAKHAVLKPCKVYYMVFYCSMDHANQDSVRHNKFCQEYLFSRKCGHLRETEGIPVPGSMPFSISRASEYKAISGSTMKDYATPTFEPEIDACLSEFVSYSLSLLYGLEHIDLKGGTKVYELRKLTVLMLDAYNCEFGSMVHCTTWEYLLHLLPKLRKINIILNEPNKKILEGNAYGVFDIDLCSDCLSKKCKINITIIKDYYSYKNSTIFRKPDVIYNHAHEDKKPFFVDDKDDYLPYPEPDVPLILLGSDKITMLHCVRWMRKKEMLGVCLPMQVNPFRGMRPTKLHTNVSENDSCLHYINQYILVMQKSSYRGIEIQDIACCHYIQV
ncbi:unnamed protein product, partial [Meganyctiphanes norvegica]